MFAEITAEKYPKNKIALQMQKLNSLGVNGQCLVGKSHTVETVAGVLADLCTE